MVNDDHVGSSFDNFLEEKGMVVEVTARALKRVLALQIVETTMAQRMGTRRAALNRLLNPKNTAVTLKTLDKIASVQGKKIGLELV